MFWPTRQKAFVTEGVATKEGSDRQWSVKDSKLVDWSVVSQSNACPPQTLADRYTGGRINVEHNETGGPEFGSADIGKPVDHDMRTPSPKRCEIRCGIRCTVNAYAVGD